MIGARAFINPGIKAVTTIVVLAAIYLLFVRPMLDTSETSAGPGAERIERAQREPQQARPEADLELARSRAESLAHSLSLSWPATAREVRSCLRGVGGDARAAARCERRGETLADAVQQDRNFALSYAGSLAAQERAGAAERVRACVKKARFAGGAMKRCRELADRLLF